MYDIATYKKRRVCVTIRKYSVKKPPYIQIRLYISYFLYIFKYHYFEISASDQWALSLKSKMFSWKNIFSNYIELAKNHEELGDFLGPKNPLTKKIHFEPSFQMLKKLNRYKSRKPTSSILAKKEKGYQQNGILLLGMVKTLDSFLYWNPILTKTQPWSRN